METSGRFRGRAAEYSRGRPTYPDAVVRQVLGEVPVRGLRIADVGAGTGLFTALLMQGGAEVVAVEPDAGMAAACQEFLTRHGQARVVVATAESTGLADACVDRVTVAQAFHWFDAAAVAGEFRRILRPGGLVAVLWNQRRPDGSAFAASYEELLVRHGNDYQEVAATWENPTALRTLFGQVPEASRFHNQQHLDRAGLHARILSSSYMPGSGTPGHDEMLTALDALFDQHATDGQVTLEYDTVVYCGPLSA